MAFSHVQSISMNGCLLNCIRNSKCYTLLFLVRGFKVLLRFSYPFGEGIIGFSLPHV